MVIILVFPNHTGWQMGAGYYTGVEIVTTTVSVSVTFARYTLERQRSDQPVVQATH